MLARASMRAQSWSSLEKNMDMTWLLRRERLWRSSRWPMGRPSGTCLIVLCCQVWSCMASVISRSVVNCLREDDVESYYASRPSSPDNSRENKDEMQIFVKEHARSTSKSSSSSFLSLKKAYQNKDRPETKVKFHIGKRVTSPRQRLVFPDLL